MEFMETYEGTIVFFEADIRYLMMLDSKKRFLLMIKNIGFDNTHDRLFKNGIVDGKRVLIKGDLGHHDELERYPNCNFVLYFTEDSLWCID
jgi:hypothetical protein